MAVEARAPCGDCNNNNKVTLTVILIKIITDGNLTLTKRLIKKKYCTYISSVKKERVGLGGSRMGTKKTRFQKREDRVHRSATTKIETLLFRNIFPLKFLLMLKLAE
jgi:hypothetical protein